MGAWRALEHERSDCSSSAPAVKPDRVLTSDNPGAVAAICSVLELCRSRSGWRPRGARPAGRDPRAARRLARPPTGSQGCGRRRRPCRRRSRRATTFCRHTSSARSPAFAVFIDGCRPDAAAAVLDPSDDEPGDVFEAITSLVEKSLLRRRDDPDGEPRVWMLETVRQFAQDLLDEPGERPAPPAACGVLLRARADGGGAPTWTRPGEMARRRVA